MIIIERWMISENRTPEKRKKRGVPCLGSRRLLSQSFITDYISSKTGRKTE
jgi:hypothetical protein